MKVPACLSVSKAARYLGVHPQTLRRRIKVEHINTRGYRPARRRLLESVR